MDVPFPPTFEEVGRPRSGALLGVLLGAVLAAFGTNPEAARAQTTAVASATAEVRTASSIQAGRAANLFVRWRGEHSADGWFLELPDGFDLLRAALQPRPDGGFVEVTVERVGSEPPRYRVGAAEPIREGGFGVFRVQTDSRPGRFDWSLVPFRVRTGKDSSEVVSRSDASRASPDTAVRDSLYAKERVAGVLQVSEATHRRGESALTFEPTRSERPVLAREEERVELSLDESYTVETWVRTVGLGEVILSTWSGREGQSGYPLELLVDRHGRLVCYRGEQDLHHSLRSEAPVADGSWHHVAVVHDDPAGWTRLVLDGEAVDSLRISSQISGEEARPIAVGGRPPGSWDGRDPSYGDVRPFMGEIEGLRLWRRPRTTPAVRRDRHRYLALGPGEGVALDFDEPRPDARLEGAEESLRFVPSDLAFMVPIQDFRARTEEGQVALNWRASGEGSGRFLVERSSDGEEYREIARVPVRTGGSSGSESTANDLREYEVRDPIGSGGVAYFRIRRLDAEGERIGSVRELKLGVGGREEDEPPTVELTGNFPNPFNGATVIRYHLREARHVRLEVWDVSGHRIATLVDQQQDAGSHEARFRPEQIPSGMYLARLETGDRTLTHTMILTK